MALLRVHQRLAGRVVHGDQDNRRLALRLEHILDVLGYFPGCGAGIKQMALRLFLVHEDSSVDRIALSRFERLVTRKDPNERWPEYAGRRLRYALLSVEQDADADEHLRVVHASYGFITLDAEGRRCKASAEKGMRDAMALMGGMMSSGKEHSNVIGAVTSQR